MRSASASLSHPAAWQACAHEPARYEITVRHALSVALASISDHMDNLQTGASPRTEQKTVTAIYTLALDQASLALDAREVSEDPRNLAWLNAHPNTETEVAPLLYRALEQSLSAGRWLFLGPLYELSDSLSASASDAEAAQMDPRRNADSDAFRRELLPLLQSEDHLSLSLLGGNRVCLHVSPACLALGEEYEITRWIDFGWQRDAFLTDSIADALSAAGADHGLLASASGASCRIPPLPSR